MHVSCQPSSAYLVFPLLQVAPQGVCTFASTNATGPITRRSAQAAATTATTANAVASIDVSAQEWKPPIPAIDTVCNDKACAEKTILRSTPIAYYNSTSVLDDLAWAGVWMYRSVFGWFGDTKVGLGVHHVGVFQPFWCSALSGVLASDCTVEGPNWC